MAKTTNEKALLRMGARPMDTSVLDASLAYSLRRAQLSTYGEFASAMDRYEIRPSQFTVLMLIRSNPGLSQSAVSVALGIQKANFVSLLDGIESRGLTERRKVEGDRRSSALYLTAVGEAFASKLEAAHTKMETKLASRLGQKRSQMLLKLLHEFTEFSHNGRYS